MWTFADFCLLGRTLGADPFTGKCPTFSATADITITNEATVDATRIVTSDGNVTTTSTLDIPLECANSDGDGGTVTPAPYADYVSFQAQLNKNQTGKPQYACTDQGSGICPCTVVETKPNPGDTKTHTTSGNTLTTTDSTGKVGQPAEYCVNGNLLTVAGQAADGGGIDIGIGLLYVLNRKP